MRLIPEAERASTLARAERAQLSIVVPFYNEATNIPALFARLVPILDGLGIAWEVVAVNDGSADDTFDRLMAAHRGKPAIKIIDLSRNFGKERALSAGLAKASGDAVIMIDADLQHPPETIPAMIEKWREGYEVVYAVRIARTDQTRLARVLSRLFYAMFDRLSEVPLPRGTGDFRLLDRKVVDVINGMPERTRFMKGIYSWVGFRQTGIPYEEAARHEGQSKWPLWGLFQLGVDGLTAFSNFPLRVWTFVGAVVSGLAFLYIVFRLLRTLIYGIDVPGYESIIMTTLFLGGVQLLTLGILGDYIGRIFSEVKGRPLYVIRTTVGLDEAPSTGREPAAADRATKI
ncbi:MAG: glycosyltransferase family 2 protein [Alphaproteobacteria bacterium]